MTRVQNEAVGGGVSPTRVLSTPAKRKEKRQRGTGQEHWHLCLVAAVEVGVGNGHQGLQEGPDEGSLFTRPRLRLLLCSPAILSQLGSRGCKTIPPL